MSDIVILGTVQEGVPSTMGAPLMLDKKTRSRSIDNNLADEHVDELESEREEAVNGKLDINIKENTIHDKSGKKDLLKHNNYH
jgi:hypothetical protein